jgi:hypothetical protein
MFGRSVLGAIAALGIALGLAAGYALWGRAPDWFAGHDVRGLAPGPATDLIAYGEKLIAETARHIGPDTADPAMRYAGNNLACTNCHMRAGLQRLAAPFVSTFTSYPLMVDDRVVTLTDRINGCMMRSMNGRPLPEESREMQGLVAYIEFLGRGGDEQAAHGGRFHRRQHALWRRPGRAAPGVAGGVGHRRLRDDADATTRPGARRLNAAGSGSLAAARLSRAASPRG